MSTSVFVFIAVSVFTSLSAANTATFRSPNGLIEQCIALPKIAGGQYSNGDVKDEELYCQIDFYSQNSVALCPKTWSTSPATMIYDISKSNLDQRAYEQQRSCGGSKDGHKSIAKYKQSMNQSKTSGTYSTSSLLYYHLSRYFDASVTVPVAVYRSMDKNAHFKRVTEKAHANRMGKGPMIQAGWEWLYRAELDPRVYRPVTDLFTDNDQQIYGAIVDGGGERYGTEINGVRSSWGDAQNHDFQNTPAFLSLRSERPLIEAIRGGLSQATTSSAKIKQDLGPGASDFQMFIWMKELTEIVIMDYIFSQQDRVGNVDYKWFIYWKDQSGEVHSKRIKVDAPRRAMAKIDYPKFMDGAPTELVQRTQINDNDAGGRVEYSNFTKRTQMLEKIRHMDPQTYTRLIELHDDFQNQGPLYQYFRQHFGLDQRRFGRILQNTGEAANILMTICLAGRLRFDLDSPKSFLRGSVREVQLNCREPRI